MSRRVGWFSFDERGGGGGRRGEEIEQVGCREEDSGGEDGGVVRGDGKLLGELTTMEDFAKVVVEVEDNLGGDGSEGGGRAGG